MPTEARQTRLKQERIFANGILQIKCSVSKYKYIVLFSRVYVYTFSDFVLQ